MPLTMLTFTYYSHCHINFENEFMSEPVTFSMARKKILRWRTHGTVILSVIVGPSMYFHLLSFQKSCNLTLCPHVRDALHWAPEIQESGLLAKDILRGTLPGFHGKRVFRVSFFHGNLMTEAVGIQMFQITHRSELVRNKLYMLCGCKNC